MADKATTGGAKQEQQKARKPQPAPATRQEGSGINGVVQRLNQARVAVTPADFIMLNRTVGMRRAMRLVNASSSRHRGVTIQPKLTVGAAHDAYEQEADAMAERVMRAPMTPDAPAPQGFTPVRAGAESVQTARDAAMGAFDAGADFEQHLGAMGGGAPLPAQSRAFMEPRFGADFSKVRVHHGGNATKLNRAISAQAFTHGHDIYLGSGKNDLDTSAGKRLLAHELTHTIQQGAAPLQRSTVRRSFNHSSTGIIQRTGDDVKIEEVEDDEQPRKWESPKEIEQPAVPLMLTDAPWSEIEARTPHERKEIAQVNDPRYQDKLNEIAPTAPKNIGKLGALNPVLKEHFQQSDTRYQNKLSDISPKAPQNVGRLGALNPVLKEHFQQSDTRYQEKLKGMGSVHNGQPGRVSEESKSALQDSFDQDKRNQAERRRLAAKLQMETASTAAKQKYDALEPVDSGALSKDAQNKRLIKAWQEEKKKGETIEYCQAKLVWAQYVLQWATERINRRALLKVLKDEIATTHVVGRFKDVFKTQANAVYEKIVAGFIAADGPGMTHIQDDYRNELQELVADHKKVDDLDNKGGKFGQRTVRELLPAVDIVISQPGFSVVSDRAKLDEAIKAFDVAYDKLSNNDQGRMKDAQKAAGKVAAHSTAGQDARGKVEETAALKKINDLFEKTKSDINGRDTRISNAEAQSLTNSTEILESFSNRGKETAAHDLKAKYEAAPYHLDPQISKIVHEERHTIKGASGYKSAVQLEQDYKDEVDKQYEATKEQWCKYLKYTNGNGPARVTNSVGGYAGVAGHNSVFIGPYTDIVMAKDMKANLPAAVELTTDELLDILYPSAGTGGAHFSLEFADPKPHAYRGGTTRPGAHYQADSDANNVTWQNAENHMMQQQQNEEARVRGLIQAAVASHMKVLHRLNPDRRKAK